MAAIRILLYHHRSLVLAVQILLSHVHLVLGSPLPNNNTPFGQSSDTWAQVVANVAPLMALVGERNAKEYMRNASSWHEFLPLATAPLGILSILVTSIRLSGPGFLRRLVGRDSERRSEALVELTPLSVFPATSVYTPHGVEIEPFYSKNKVAFVCGHVSKVSDVVSAITAFRDLLRRYVEALQLDRDTEIALAIWGSSLQLKEVAQLVTFFEAKAEKDCLPVFNARAIASISYRTTGVSPTQTVQRYAFFPQTRSQWQDLAVAMAFAIMCIGLQVLGLLEGSGGVETFSMAIVGYVTVAGFTIGLLAMVKSEIVAECETLPAVFERAYWTFSDSRHAEHKPFGGPPGNTLVVARPRERNQRDRVRAGVVTTVLAFGLSASYVVLYLSLRVAPWWVGMGVLGTIWLGAFYRATVSRNFLVATDQDTGKHEHWIGMFRNTVSESLLATLECSAKRVPSDALLETVTPSSEGTLVADDYIVIEPKDTANQHGFSNQTIFFLVPPIRTGMRTWSGTEDIMKVGLEVAKHGCKQRSVNFQTLELRAERWLRLVRFRMEIYVPGLVWRSDEWVDFALPKDFDLEHLVRLIIKLLHICMDHVGDFALHDVNAATSARLSHVLCGPIADVAPSLEAFQGSKTSLRQVLSLLRDHPSTMRTNKYTLEQAVLLPTAIIASIYETWYHAQGIAHLQKRHVDGLSLSGKDYLPVLESEFSRLGIWDSFMVNKTMGPLKDKDEIPAPRDATSGNYEVHNLRDRLTDAARSAKPLGEDGDHGNHG